MTFLLGSATKPNDSVSTPIGDIGYESISSGEDIDDIIGDMKDDEQDEHAGRKSGALSWKHKSLSSLSCS